MRPFYTVPLFSVLAGFCWIGHQPACAQTGPTLSLPIACTIGADCVIQQLADVDPGPAIKDYRCGSATYDNHGGTDFRILTDKTPSSGVAVLAAADGIVKRRRDGMPDRPVKSKSDLASIRGKECGNGVVISHGGGWETQYCHLKAGSLAVKRGQRVKAGTPIGKVGLSGKTQFPHVHFMVTHKGQKIDPFLGRAFDGTCIEAAGPLASSMWRKDLLPMLAYPDAAIIRTGFSSATVSIRQLESDEIVQANATGAMLVFYAQLINLQRGDNLRIKIKGPDGFTVASNSRPLPRNKAQFVAFAGKKLRRKRWPAGIYEASVETIRSGQIISLRREALNLR